MAETTSSRSTSTTRMPRVPKLRASCDECGAAKLKCDRGQPNCGRCISLGLNCVYGVSRKAGKPRRDPQNPPRPRHTPSDSALSRPDYNPPLGVGPAPNSPTSPTVSAADRAALAAGLLPTPGGARGASADMPTPDWATGQSTAFMAIDDLCAWDPKNPLPLGDATLESISDSFLDSSLFLTPGKTPGLEGYDPLNTIPPAQIPNLTDPNVETGLPPSNSDHDCLKEAFDILASLSFQPSTPSQQVPPPTPSSASTPDRTMPPMTLDHVLGLSREATRRLSPLLACSCTRSPHLELLYASIISRILIWYQQAIFTPQTTQSSSTTSLSGTESHRGSIAASTSSSTTALSASADKTSPISTKPTELFGAPLEIAIGSFSVDDLRVQAAVQVQLLSGEIRRVGTLIDQFTSRSSSGPYGMGEDIIGGAGSLYQSLDSWLRGKHSSLVNLTRSKLRELDC